MQLIYQKLGIYFNVFSPVEECICRDSAILFHLVPLKPIFQNPIGNWSSFQLYTQLFSVALA